MNIEKVIDKIKNCFSKDEKRILLITFLLGMLVHFELYSNELLFTDGYWHYGSFLSKGWEVSLGRYGLPFIDIFRGTLVSSILSSTLAIITMSITGILLVKLLNIKKTYIKLLITILLVVTPTFSLTLMYPYTADSYSSAMFLSVLSVYIFRQKQTFKNVLLSIICLVISLSLYQAYVCVAISLFFITFILDLITNNNLSFKQTSKQLLANIIVILASFVIYYIGLYIILIILNLNITEYSGGNKILSLETILNIIPSIKNCYITFYEFYFKDSILYNTEFWHRHILNAIMLSLILINFIIIVYQHKTYKDKYKILIIVSLLALSPIFLCIIQLIAQQRKMGLLMATSLFLPFILLLKQVDLLKITKLGNLLSTFSIISTIILIWSFILSDNATYLVTKMYSNQMYSMGIQIMNKVNSNEEYENKPLIIIGNMKFNIDNPTLIKMVNLSTTRADQSIYASYYKNNINVQRDLYYSEEITNEIKNTNEFIEMSIFPNKNSIKVINDIVVVKVE